MAEIAANYLLMDRLLVQYGPEANDARGALRAVLERQLAGEKQSGSSRTYNDIKAGTQVGETIVD